MTPICRGCGLRPDEIAEYIMRCEDEDDYGSPAEVVRREEGTFNQVTGMFWCSACFISQGMPTGTA